MFQVLFICTSVLSDYIPGTRPRSYKQGDEILLFVDTIDSFQTQIPYDYYYLKFCKPKHIEEQAENIGQILSGDKIENTPYKIFMNESSKIKELCASKTLNEEDKDNFAWMIKNHYYSNWILDQLPAGYRVTQTSNKKNFLSYTSGIPIGFESDGKIFVYNHLHFIIKFDKSKESDDFRVVGFIIQPFSIDETLPEAKDELESLIDQSKDYVDEILDPNEVITVNYHSGTSLVAHDLTSDSITYSYSVSFEKSETHWSSRWDNYLYKEKAKVHWFSILNSFGMVIFLSLMVLHLFRKNVSRDISNYNDSIDEDPEVDSGWKQLRGDVFRAPSHINLFCAFIGTGVQIILMTLFTLTFASIGLLRPEHRGALVSIMLFLFAFMGIFSGYISARFYKTLGGEHWKVNSLTVSLLFPGICFLVFFLINFLIWEEESSGAVSFWSLLELLYIWFAISLPLTMIGSGLGYKKRSFKNPCKTSKIPKPIPLRNNKLVILVCLLAGSLPFGCMFIELNYIMNSIWHISLFYYLFGFLLMCFVVLSLTSAEVSILMTYVVLCREDFRWWWVSFGVAGSSGFYMFLYSTAYFFVSLEITRFSSTILYFGYMTLVSLAYAFITGTIGFFSTYLFVRKIYSMIKSE
jgi:transmembrane 9 superfamily protein 2/4